MATPAPRATSPRRAAARRRRRDALRRWLAAGDRGRLLLLTLLTLGAAALTGIFVDTVSATALMVPLLLCDMLLSPRQVPRFALFLLLVLGGTTCVQYGVDDIPTRRWVSILLVLISVLIVLSVASRRTRLGVGGLTVDALLLDLQDRIRGQATLPPLPASWHAEMATRSAGGTSFAGDFVVAHRAPGGTELSVVVVDVSGKGVDAGSRSLVLSGAFSALLGAAPADSFLDAANAFVVRQGWSEDFATAVHLRLDLETGDYALRCAGHPPAVLFHAGAGRWDVMDAAEGPLLGMSGDAVFVPVRGRLERHDTVLLYTDGLVERRFRDIRMGIDRLVGEAERLLHSGFRGSAQVLVDRLGAVGDDCALVVLERS